MNEILNGDCLELMTFIPNASIDMVLCDLPYGTTACKWDTVIDFTKLWAQYERIIKPNGAIVLSGQNPFTAALIMSNTKLYKYDWFWQKNSPCGFANVKKMPLKDVETVSVFYKKPPTYNPQGVIRCDLVKKNSAKSKVEHSSVSSINGGAFKTDTFVQEFTNYPRQILDIKVERGLHPTQKPVALFEYLIKTYTNEGDLILDNCAGSGTTGVACENTGRRYILMEQDPVYFQTIKERLNYDLL